MQLERYSLSVVSGKKGLLWSDGSFQIENGTQRYKYNTKLLRNSLAACTLYSLPTRNTAILEVKYFRRPPAMPLEHHVRRQKIENTMYGSYLPYVLIGYT